MTPAWAYVWLALGALAGSTPFGVLIARLRGVDIQQRGSGNIGATNVARVMGKGAGVIVLLLDAGKGAGPVLAAGHQGGSPTVLAATGVAAVLGHCFSPWLRFHGGKGVATALGVFLVLLTHQALIAMGVFIAVIALTRVPALGSLAGTFAVAILAVAGICAPVPHAYAIAAALLAVLIVFTHRSNLRGLMARWRDISSAP